MANLDLTTTWADGSPWDGDTAQRVTRALSTQALAALKILGNGVVDGFEVTDSGGLFVDIAVGSGIATHSSKGAFYIETAVPVLNLAVTNNVVNYIWAEVELSTNDTRETALPKFTATLINTNANGILLATVTVSGGIVTHIEDNRSFVSLGGDLVTWTVGSGVPTGGSDGDLYLRSTNGDVYQRAGGLWSVVANIKGPTGSTGAAGATGSTGATGTAGATWSSGSVVPDNANGVNGDFYLNINSWSIYKKITGAWVQQTNIKGVRGAPGGSLVPQGNWATTTAYVVLDSVRNGGASYYCKVAHTSGSTTEPGVGVSWTSYWVLFAADGADGDDGAAGSVIYNGSGAPGGGVGIDGDYYLDTDTLDFYVKAAGSWGAVVNLTANIAAPTVVSPVSTVFTPDLANGDYFYGTLAADSTLAAPTGTPVDGKPYVFEFAQNGTGGWALTLDSVFDDTGLTWDASTMAASKTLIIYTTYSARTLKYMVADVRIFA